MLFAEAPAAARCLGEAPNDLLCSRKRSHPEASGTAVREGAGRAAEWVLGQGIPCGLTTKVGGRIATGKASAGPSSW
jgi:hypothetical protein